MKLKYLLIICLFSISNTVFSLIRTVPGNFPTIQAAINVSVNGDTVLVSPGTYFENINFRGRNIVITSLYYLNKNVSFINSTIINGSAPAFADTASCVIFNHNETPAAILQGFTITGGKGSKWANADRGGIFREGGGILIEGSSPTIRHNFIRNNIVTDSTGVTAAGGGGIRVGNGEPLICSNAVLYNEAGYGAGIVLNYTAGRISNNVIASNTGGNKFNGGSGIWTVGNYSASSIQIDNNTIVKNTSLAAGGASGLLVGGTYNVSLTNNIVWDNLPATQIRNINGMVAVAFSDVQGGYMGLGNINQNPLFGAAKYYLMTGSPCIDNGHQAGVYDDNEDASNLGNALFPSLAFLRNDMGAYGGPCASDLPDLTAVLAPTGLNSFVNDAGPMDLYPVPVVSASELKFNLQTAQTIKIELFDLAGRKVLSAENNRMEQGVHQVRIHKGTLGAGIYILKAEGSEGFSGTLKFVVAEL